MKAKLRLSPSRASDFRTCPQLYKFRVIDRLPEPPSEAQLRGTIVHKALELLLTMSPDRRTREAASEVLEIAIASHEKDIQALLESLTIGQPVDTVELDEKHSAQRHSPTLEALTEKLRSAGEELLDNYFKLEDPSSVEPIAMEKWVSALLTRDSCYSRSNNGAADHDQVELIGVIDRIEQNASGHIVITDYKTGSVPAKNFERDAFFGLRFYSVILARSFSLAKAPARIRLFYLQEAQVLEDTVTDSVVSSTAKLIAAIADAIERAHDTDDWRTNPGRLCDSCHFKQICPAHN